MVYRDLLPPRGEEIFGGFDIFSHNTHPTSLRNAEIVAATRTQQAVILGHRTNSSTVWNVL